MPQHFHICREQRESLIDDLPFATEQSHITIPAESRVASILHERWKFNAQSFHLLQVLHRNITNSEQSRAPSITLVLHRLPNFRVRIGPIVSRGGTVQDETINIIGAKMLERTRHR